MSNGISCTPDWAKGDGLTGRAGFAAELKVRIRVIDSERGLAALLVYGEFRCRRIITVSLLRDFVDGFKFIYCGHIS